MNEWKITTPTGEKIVKAMAMLVTVNGDLVLSNLDGQVLHSFAVGQWHECELQARVQSGYGGT